MGEMTQLRIYADRPPEFWVAMGPMFADPKIKRARPYLHDEPGFVWTLAMDPEGKCVSFLAFEFEGEEGCIREFWEDKKPGEIAADTFGLLKAALTRMRKNGVNYVHGRLEATLAPVLKKNKMKTVATRGKYIDVEARF